MEMDFRKLKFDEKLLVEVINHSLEVFKLDELNTEDEVQEAIGAISLLSSKFRHRHVAQEELDPDYAAYYPDYDI